MSGDVTDHAQDTEESSALEGIEADLQREQTTVAMASEHLHVRRHDTRAWVGEVLGHERVVGLMKCLGQQTVEGLSDQLVRCVPKQCLSPLVRQQDAPVGIDDHHSVGDGSDMARECSCVEVELCALEMRCECTVSTVVTSQALSGVLVAAFATVESLRIVWSCIVQYLQ